MKNLLLLILLLVAGTLVSCSNSGKRAQQSNPEPVDSIRVYRAQSLQSTVIAPAKCRKSVDIYRTGDTVWVMRDSRMIVQVTWDIHHPYNQIYEPVVLK